jgi:hypothetical protein
MSIKRFGIRFLQAWHIALYVVTSEFLHVGKMPVSHSELQELGFIKLTADDEFSGVSISFSYVGCRKSKSHFPSCFSSRA